MSEISWKALEHSYTKKSADWFWAVGIISVAIAVIGVIIGNLLLSVLILVGAFALVLQSVKIPQEMQYSVGERGIAVGNTLYPYGTLESFWVHDHDETGVLLIKSKKTFVPLISIPIEEVRPVDVRATLLEHPKEEEMNEPVAQQIMERLGF